MTIPIISFLSNTHISPPYHYLLIAAPQREKRRGHPNAYYFTQFLFSTKKASVTIAIHIEQ
jgi:hypothetical protein